MKQRIAVFLCSIILACNDKNNDLEPEIRADFTIKIDETNFHKVHFINKTENAAEFFRDFGNSRSSTLENPTCIYANAGSYDVRLTAHGAERHEGFQN
jgi:PKD repeat protein